MWGSASWLDTADRPMKTSIPGQRKRSGKRQHLLFQAWQQKRGREVATVEPEKKTER